MMKERQYESSLRRTFNPNLGRPALPPLSVHHVRRMSGKPQGQKKKYTLDHFRLHRTIGTGTFARVRLARYKGTDRVVVLKIMKKSSIVKKRQIEHVNNERKLLRSFKHPFIVNMIGTFQDSSHLYLVLEYVPGGELYSHLRTQKVFSADFARFYAAEIVSAFLYIHSQGVVYRDLKPENVLISKDGHVKLVDFGFVKVLKCGQKTNTLCGTPEYLAPEIIVHIGHSFPADWWTIGIFLYEMLIGKPPFVDKNPQIIYKKILEEDPEIPEGLPDGGLIQALLKKNPDFRAGPDTVKGHSFFRNINWREVDDLKLVPPIVPQLNSSDDSSYFDTYQEEIGGSEKPRYIKGDYFSEF